MARKLFVTTYFKAYKVSKAPFTSFDHSVWMDVPRECDWVGLGAWWPMSATVSKTNFSQGKVAMSQGTNLAEYHESNFPEDH